MNQPFYFFSYQINTIFKMFLWCFGCLIFLSYTFTLFCLGSEAVNYFLYFQGCYFPKLVYISLFRGPMLPPQRSSIPLNKWKLCFKVWHIELKKNHPDFHFYIFLYPSPLVPSIETGLHYRFMFNFQATPPPSAPVCHSCIICNSQQSICVTVFPVNLPFFILDFILFGLKLAMKNY